MVYVEDVTFNLIENITKPWRSLPVNERADGSLQICTNVFIEENKYSTTTYSLVYNKKVGRGEVSSSYKPTFYRVYFKDEEIFKGIRFSLKVDTFDEFNLLGKLLYPFIPKMLSFVVDNYRYGTEFDSYSKAREAAQMLVYAVQKGLVKFKG